MYHASVNASLAVKTITRIESGIMINICVNVEIQKKIV